MTRLRWTDRASEDFLSIIAWLGTHSPDAAHRVGQRILNAVDDVVAFPLLGKPGRSQTTRERVVARLPYLIVYSAQPEPGPVEVVTILRVLHGAMQWPP